MQAKNLSMHQFGTDPIDVRNEPQQGTRPQASSSLIFLCVNLNSHFHSLLRKPHL